MYNQRVLPLCVVIFVAFGHVTLGQPAAAPSSATKCKTHRGAIMKQNGYEDVRIWIESSVREEANILNDITNLFKRSSRTLYEAIYQRGYIRTVKVILPRSWNHTVAHQDATAEDLDPRLADFKLVVALAERIKDRPKVVRAVNRCGREADHILLTPGFLKQINDRELNETALKLLVQAWAQYRYGVFPEYFDTELTHDVHKNFPFDARYCEPHFDPTPTSCPYVDTSTCGTKGCYRDERGRVCHPCQHGFRYRFGEHSRKRAPTCQFFDVPTKAFAQTSLMFTAQLKQVFRFCNDSNHNSLAKNVHNSVCALESVMSVILRDADFLHECTGNGRSGQVVDWPEEETKVIFVRAPETNNAAVSTAVFVLDMSGSMDADTPTRLSVLKRAFAGALECAVDGMEIGIVVFRSDYGTQDTKVLVDLTVVDKTTRGEIQSEVESARSGGGTPLGNGILTALNTLGNKSKGAKMIIISDGEENNSPYAYDEVVQTALKNASLSIHTIAISQEASRVLSSLAKDFGGRSYFISTANEQWSKATQEVIKQLCQIIVPSQLEDKNVNVKSEVARLTDGKKTGTFHVDKFGRKDLLLLFNIDAADNAKHISVELVSPSGAVINSTSPFYSTSTEGSVTIRIPLAEVGLWQFTITSTRISKRAADVPRNNGQSSDVVSVLIYARNEEEMEENVLTVTAEYSQTEIVSVATEALAIYATVLLGQSPVLNADVKTTVVIAGSGTTETLTLLDDGLDPDAGAGDGIYSAYFKILSNGYYSATTKVTDNNGTAVTYILESDQDGNGTYYYSNNETEFTGEFERTVENGEFHVNDPCLGVRRCIPPGPITTLEATLLNASARIFELRWIATGDDMNDGRADYYEICFSVDDNAENIRSGCLAPTRLEIDPEHSGRPQNTTFTLPSTVTLNRNSTVFFAIRAVDGDTNVGPWPVGGSRIALAVFAMPEQITVDNIPPNQITNFRLIDVNTMTREAEFSWTAPGNDGDIGTAAFYTITCTCNDSLSNSVQFSTFDNIDIIKGSLRPHEAGYTESVTVILPMAASFDLLPNELLSCVIRATDDSPLKNTGEESNVAQLMLETPPTPTAGGLNMAAVGAGIAAGLLVLGLVAFFVVRWRLSKSSRVDSNESVTFRKSQKDNANSDTNSV